MRIGQKLKYMGSLPNSTFNETKIYHVSRLAFSNCKCHHNTPLITLAEEPYNGNNATGCSVCKESLGDRYWLSAIFKSVTNLNKNIKIL